MKNFITWVTEKLNKDEGFYRYTEKDTREILDDIYETLVSDGNKEWDGKHYGDCNKQNVSCRICEFHNLLDEYEKYVNFVKNNKNESNTRI